jgi:hypothetical protein
LFLIKKFFEGEKNDSKDFTRTRLGADDEIFKRLLDFEELLLKIERVINLEFF